MLTVAAVTVCKETGVSVAVEPAPLTVRVKLLGLARAAPLLVQITPVMLSVFVSVKPRVACVTPTDRLGSFGEGTRTTVIAEA